MIIYFRSFYQIAVNYIVFHLHYFEIKVNITYLIKMTPVCLVPDMEYTRQVNVSEWKYLSTWVKFYSTVRLDLFIRRGSVWRTRFFLINFYSNFRETFYHFLSVLFLQISPMVGTHFWSIFTENSLTVFSNSTTDMQTWPTDTLSCPVPQNTHIDPSRIFNNTLSI